MKLLSILMAKIALIFGKILNRGSSLPGKVALKIDKKILSKLQYVCPIIAVTGSSGKGSTSNLIAEVLRDNNKTVCHNDSGSNLAWGITTSLIKNSTIFGKIKTDYIVLEIDERYAKTVFQDLKPDYLIITNITKDQPPRQYNVEIIYNEILMSIPSNTKIITNMDEPFLRKFALDLPNENIYYSITQNKYSYKSQIFENLNIYFCPKCHTFLEYDYYNFETLGKYNCPNCDFKYIEPSTIAYNLNLEDCSLVLNDKKVNIGGDMLYYAYNTLAAITTLQELKIEFSAIINSVNKLNISKSLNFKAYKKEFIPLSSKAENASTYNQSIFKVISDNRPKDIIIGWKEISRRYKHFDISWLYDIEFELLNNSTIGTFYACGIDKNNIKQRLILAGIKESQIITADSLLDIKEHIINSESEVIYGILNFDYIDPFTETFKEEESCK